MLDLGGVTIHWLGGGEFHLDGGTMFGAVPKVLWEKRYPPTRGNCIPLRNAPLLVQADGRRLLIDTGLGDKLDDRQLAMFQVSAPWRVEEDLAALGLGPEDIDYVILTHLDFDHAGGVTRRGPDGPRLTFPRARHVVQDREWADFRRPNRRSAHTYFAWNMAGVEEAGLLHLVDGEAMVAPGVRVRLSGGHTRGHQVVEIRGENAMAVHLGDVLPTHAHSNPLWIMAYDNFPLEIIEVKAALLDEYRDGGAWFTFYHDQGYQACRFDDRGRVTEAVAWAGSTAG